MDFHVLAKCLMPSFVSDFLKKSSWQQADADFDNAEGDDLDDFYEIICKLKFYGRLNF